MSHLPSLAPNLLPQHQALLKASAISAAVVAARGYYSEEIPARLGKLGFSHAQWRTPCLVIPIHGVTGEIVLHQLRPDEPRERNGKPIKYETPARARMVIDVPPRSRAMIGNPNVPLYVTEGVRKADAAVTLGLCCIALLGVWNWRGTNEDGGKTVLADWEYIALKGREVCLAFDSDVTSKPQVQEALLRLKVLLEHRGAHVKALALPSQEDGGKVGLDDYFAAGHTVEEFRQLPSVDLSAKLSHTEENTPAHPVYRSTPEGLVWEKPIKDGTTLVPLTNFDARIIREVRITDGVDEWREFDIEATLGSETKRVHVRAEEFERLNWVVPTLGAGALIHAGYGIRDHARAAIQSLSTDIEQVTAYGHLGWVKHEGQWVYLHAEGAIGADSGAVVETATTDRPSTNLEQNQELASNGTIGPILRKQAPILGIQLRLPTALSRYILPRPPSEDRLVESIQASLRMLECGPDHITLPLYAAIWRAPLGPAAFSTYIVGSTGQGKSVIAALAQQHYGATMDYLNLPGSWSSTANALEGTAFLAKDVLFTVDDWVPRGAQSDVQRANRDADRFFLAQGNHAGRARCNRDGTPKEGKPPRGLVVSTGEATPEGHSLNARLLVTEVRPGDLLTTPAKLPCITRCQKEAREGLYAEALAGYVQWLAENYEAKVGEMRDHVEELRQEIEGEADHLRTNTVVAELMAGFDVFSEFAEEKGAINAEEREALWVRLWEALKKLMKDQNRQLAMNDPVELFLEITRSNLLTGRCHLADSGGGVPLYNPALHGWEEKTIGVKAGDGSRDDSTEERKLDQDGDEIETPEEFEECESVTGWFAKGRRIGWVDNNIIYLDSAATLAAAQEVARQFGQCLPFGPKSLSKALAARGILEFTDPKRDRYLVRRTILGKRISVLCLLGTRLFDHQPGSLEEFGPLLELDA